MGIIFLDKPAGCGMCSLLKEKDEKIKELEKQVDYFTNKFRSRDFKKTGDWEKDVELYMNSKAIKVLESLKSSFMPLDDTSIFLTYEIVGIIDNKIEKLRSK